MSKTWKVVLLSSAGVAAVASIYLIGYKDGSRGLAMYILEQAMKYPVPV